MSYIINPFWFGAAIPPDPIPRVTWTAGSITSGSPASLSRTGCRAVRYSIYLPKGKLEWALRNTTYDAYRILYDSSNTILAQTDPDSSTITYEIATEGTYILEVTSAATNTNGDFEIWWNRDAFESEITDTISFRTTLTGQSTSGSSWTGYKSAWHGNRFAYYKFNTGGDQSRRWQLKLANNTFDTYHYVLSSDRSTIIAESDGTDMRVVLSQSTDYVLAVTGFANNTSGSFDIVTNGEPIDSEISLIGAGTHSGSTSSADYLAHSAASSKTAKWYRFTTNASGTITANLSDLGGWDSQHYLLDSSRAELANSDSPNATFTIPSAGAYYLLITGWNAGTYGTYTLTLSGSIISS